MIKGDMGKESFARAQGKYLYQCEVKASHRWCQAAGIFIVYKLLLLQLDFGRKGTKERTVSQQESLSLDKTAWTDRNVKMQNFYAFFKNSIARDHQSLCDVRLTCPARVFWACLGVVWTKKRDTEGDHQPPLAKVTSDHQIMRLKQLL